MGNIEEIYKRFNKSNGVCIDTRKLKPGEMFFAIEGKNFDGHEFIEDALRLGASTVISAKEIAVKDERIYRVANTLLALQGLAREHRSRLSEIEVVVVGGSNGKTTTKELIGRVLGTSFTCFTTIGNYNNHIGLPLSVLKLKRSHKFAILEIGANHLREHELLLGICQPNYGVVTNCGKDHLEGYKTVDNVIKSNKEIYDYLSNNGGKSFVNASDPVLVKASEATQQIFYAERKDYFNPEKVVLGEITEMFPFLNVSVHPTDSIITSDFNVNTHLFGSFQLYNILAAATIGLYFNVGADDIKNAIESYIPENNRSQIVQWYGNTIILDAYNANPSSMELMIKDFSKSPFDRKIVVLGEMSELGSFAEEEHRSIINLVMQSDIDDAIFIGETFLSVKHHLDLNIFASVDDAKDLIEGYRNKGVAILAKGSREIAVEKAFDLSHDTRINNFTSHPIKLYNKPTDFNVWKTIPIVESHDPLIEISNFNERILCKPMYFERGLSGALLNCYTRQSIAKKLQDALVLLPDNIGFLIYGGWRPLEVQQKLFDDYLSTLAENDPSLTERELIEKAQKFVSLPSSSPNKPSPHYTGGSIDLTLIDVSTGAELAMGTVFDDFTEKASTNYFEANGTVEDQDIVKNRRLLYHTLCSVGFVNYHAEWWHYDFGNQWWARRMNTVAIYGPININQ